MLCRVCGREFDPQGFQVVVPGLGQGFDRVECALEASAPDLPPALSPAPLASAARPMPLALPAVVAAGAPALAVTSRASARPSMLVGANLALLAAGTAATIYLWLRVFSPDAASLTIPADGAAAAFGRTSIAAEVDLSPEPARPQPEAVVFGGSRAAPTEGEAAPGASGPTLASNPSQPQLAPSKGGNGGPTVRPSPPPPPPEPPPAPPPRQTPLPAPPVPTTPPADRIPGPTLPGPGLPGDTGPVPPGA